MAPTRGADGGGRTPTAGNRGGGAAAALPGAKVPHGRVRGRAARFLGRGAMAQPHRSLPGSPHPPPGTWPAPAPRLWAEPRPKGSNRPSPPSRPNLPRAPALAQEAPPPRRSGWGRSHAPFAMLCVACLERRWRLCCRHVGCVLSRGAGLVSGSGARGGWVTSCAQPDPVRGCVETRDGELEPRLGERAAAVGGEGLRPGSRWGRSQGRVCEVPRRHRLHGPVAPPAPSGGSAGRARRGQRRRGGGRWALTGGGGVRRL